MKSCFAGWNPSELGWNLPPTASDEIKSAILTCRKADFIAQRFHPRSGFIPTQADLTEKDCNFVSKLQSFFYPNRRFGISSRFSVHLISSFGSVYHHGIAVHTLSCGLMIYNAPHWWYTRPKARYTRFRTDDIHFLRKWLNYKPFFVFSRLIQIVHFIPLSFNLWGIVQLLIRLKELLIFNGLCDIINSTINKNLTATFKMINKLVGDLYD